VAHVLSSPGLSDTLLEEWHALAQAATGGSKAIADAALTLLKIAAGQAKRGVMASIYDPNAAIQRQRLHVSIIGRAAGAAILLGEGLPLSAARGFSSVARAVIGKPGPDSTALAALAGAGLALALLEEGTARSALAARAAALSSGALLETTHPCPRVACLRLFVGRLRARAACDALSRGGPGAADVSAESEAAYATEASGGGGGAQAGEQRCSHELCAVCSFSFPFPAGAGAGLPGANKACEEREERLILGRYLWPALESAVGGADCGRALSARLAHLADLDEAQASTA
jgi:hypothetical protein